MRPPPTLGILSSHSVNHLDLDRYLRVESDYVSIVRVQLLKSLLKKHDLESGASLGAAPEVFEGLPTHYHSGPLD